MKLNSALYHERKITDDKSLEDIIALYLDMISQTELYYSKKDLLDTNYITRLRKHIMNGAIIISTPMLLAVQGKCGFSSCGIISVDLQRDYESLKSSLFDYLVMGRGLGFALDEVYDPKEALYKLNKIFLETEKYCSRMAGMATLRIDHPKILEFITAKRDIDYNDFRFNISIMIDDEFMEKAIIGKKQKYKNKERYIIHKIAENMHNCGEPGVLFISKIDRDNPIPKIKYVSVSPCAEIAMAEGEECVFGYLNLNQFIVNNEIDYKNLESATASLTRMLDDTITIIEKNIGDNTMLSLKRRIGIGVCGLADVFLKLNLEYGSIDSLKLTKNIFSNINYFSKKESIRLSKERGAFPLFNDSLYMNYSWFMRFADNIDDNQKRFEWGQLFYDLKKYGIRNSSTMAIPPTANSAKLVDASYSIEPFFNLNGQMSVLNLLEEVLLQNNIDPEKILPHVKKYGNLEGIVLNEKIKKLFATQKEICFEKQIAVIAEVQKQIDNSISKTITVHKEADIDMIEDIIFYSYENNLKGITVFRNKD